MMKWLLLKFIFIFLSFSLAAQQHFSVYLIGDAGESEVSGKALLMLQKELFSHPNSAVIFLGDNVYPEGLKTNNKIDAAHLESQLLILKEYKGQIYFIPGNHDWEAQKPNGLQTLKNQEEYVMNYLRSNSDAANKNASTFLPQNGLPGPESVLLNDHLRLIIIDTQWFLHLFKKNKVGTKINTQNLFYSKLDSILQFAKQNREQVIIAAHHPLFTNGQHSRHKQPLRFLINYTPFKLFGLMGLNRLFSQDIVQPRYKKMRKKMLHSFDRYDNIIYASGHEHNLQCFKNGSNKYIVSGAGSKLRSLRKKKVFDPIFQDDTKTGFIKVEYAADGSHTTTIYKTDEKPIVLEGF
ncbi:MAG: metallophosphoesterase [Bacteroidota bacterium]